MATYFHSSNSERDAAPMLYLREPWPSSNSESPVIPGNMMMYMNYSSSSGSCTDALAGNSQQQQQQNSCREIPSVGASVSAPSPQQQEILSNLGGSRIGEQDFSGWGNGRSEVPFMHLMGEATGIQGVQNLQGQGLSLSLSPQIPAALQLSSMEYRNPNSCFSSFLSPNLSISGGESGRSASFRDDENSQNKQMRNFEYMQPGFLGGNVDSMKMDLSPYGMSSVTRTIPNSKYLRAAQQLLDEVVNVQKALKQKDSKKDLTKGSKELDGESEKETTLPPVSATSSNPQEPINNPPTDLSAAERQDLQIKLTKLLSMLDEVDKRYKQYYHQMHIVVSSFDAIAGPGAAKPYTALALQTISRHFRCLRDAITGQIRATRRSLGEQDAPANGNGVGISRLRYVDQHLRQQKALQQLGMMQQHAWRPQRGLPESSVSVLRAWLFEHFLHPYPKDSDKIMLARQTGLTRSQVSNWFINARVRLWKPMVEEMYKEETGDAEMDSNSSSEIAPKATKGDVSASEDKGEDLQQTATSTAVEHSSAGRFHDSKRDHLADVEMAGTATDDTLFPDTVVQSNGGNDRFMTSAAAAYHLSELGRFGNGSGGVSLTLGLQHCEAGGGGSLPMPVVTHRSFVSVRGGDEVYNAESSSVGPQAADFGSSSHLLHDFVA